MPLLLETIKIENGKAQHLAYHQKRFDRSRNALFPTQPYLDLAAQIKVPSSNLYRCRILYDAQIQSIEYLPYKEKNIQSIKIIQANIDYSFKYAQRDCFNTLTSQHLNYDEIIIEKNGLLTDTSIANLAFYDGKQWYTPETPLLEGTTRERLLAESFLHKKAIHKKDLSHYTHVALMNAMTGFKILDIGIIE